MLTLRLIDLSSTITGVALALLAAVAFVAARRLHSALFVAAAAFLVAATPRLILGALDALAWFGIAQLSLPPSLGWLIHAQGHLLLVAALAAVWSTGVLLRQDRPNSSLKRTDQSLRD
jgi:hypothetical protein